MELPRLILRLSLSAAAATSFAGAVTGCADENDPRTWVKRLDDPARRPVAIERLGRSFTDAMAKANGNRADQSVSGLVDTIAEPLTKTYTTATLDPSTRKALMKEIADLRDVRTAPALAKALSECEAGKNDEDARYAAHAVAALASKLTDPAVALALWSCVDTFQVHTATSSDLARDLRDAAVAVKSPSYGPKAAATLSAPVDAHPDTAKDELELRQSTAAQVLGALGLADGVKPLVAALLTPSKRSLRGVVSRALLQMPKESEPVLVAALGGQDPELAKLEADFGPSKEYVAVLAESLAWLSRPSGRDAVLGALASTDADDDRVALATSLVQWPPDPRILPMYLDAYRKLSPKHRAALLSSAPQLYDPTLVDWMLKEVAAAKGDGVEDEMRRKGLHAAIEAMTPAQMKTVGDSVAKYGTPLEQDMLKVASEVLTKCNTDASCYVAVLDDPVATGDIGELRPRKGAYMAVVFGRGSPNVRGDLLARVEKVRGPGARVALVEAIDRLSPSGDVKAADALDQVVAADRAAGDAKTIAADEAVAKVALRLRARAL